MKQNIIFLLATILILSACSPSPRDIVNTSDTIRLSGTQKITQVYVGSGSDDIPEPGSFDPKISGVSSYYPIMTPPSAETGATNNNRDMLPPSLPMVPPR